MAYINLIDDYEQQLPASTLRLRYPETLTFHYADCPYGCDDFGELENPFIGGAERCPYCG